MRSRRFGLLPPSLTVQPETESEKRARDDRRLTLVAEQQSVEQSKLESKNGWFAGKPVVAFDEKKETKNEKSSAENKRRKHSDGDVDMAHSIPSSLPMDVDLVPKPKNTASDKPIALEPTMSVASSTGSSSVAEEKTLSQVPRARIDVVCSHSPILLSGLFLAVFLLPALGHLVMQEIILNLIVNCPNRRGSLMVHSSPPIPLLCLDITPLLVLCCAGQRNSSTSVEEDIGRHILPHFKCTGTLITHGTK
jgi:hypothetical protein